MLYHSTPTERVNVPNRWNQKMWNKLNSYIDANIQQFKAKGLIANQREFTIKSSNNANINFPLEHSIDQIVAKGHTAPIFLYRFDFDGKFGMYKNDVIKSQLIDARYGAVHGDDLGYIFNPYILREALNRRKNYQKEWMVHDRMSEMVARFVKFGNPSLEDFQWTAYNAESDQKQYAVIDESFEMKTGSLMEPHSYSFCKVVYDCLYYFNCTSIEIC
uniref:(northern house mosquito) hypothetical protein n=1 Tax=Culex pipiens TaxID=7175 RepID=A0A8D8F791_CULPI